MAPVFGLPNKLFGGGFVIGSNRNPVTGATTIVDVGVGFEAATTTAAAAGDDGCCFFATALKKPNSCNFRSISKSFCCREFEVDVDEDAVLDI